VYSNLPKLTRTFPVGLHPPTSQRFEAVRCSRTFSNSLQTALHASFPLHHSGLRRFGAVKPPRTHSNLPCRPASPFVTVIRGGSVYSNLPKLTRTFPVGQLPPTSQWFEEVRCSQTSSNSLQTTLQASFPLRHSGSRKFGWVEPPQTHSNLPCRPALNLTELTPNCPSGQLPPSSQWFGGVRCGQTAPNSLEPSL